MNNTPVLTPTRHTSQTVLCWGITFIWAALIFTLSTETYGGSFSAILLRDILDLVHVVVSPASFDVLHHLFRKSAHVTEYAIFSLLLYHCRLGSPRTTWRPGVAAWSVAMAAAYSLTDEFHQIFVPNRGPSLWDCGIDTMGAILGVVVVFTWTRLFSGRKPDALGRQKRTADPALQDRPPLEEL